MSAFVTACPQFRTTTPDNRLAQCSRFRQIRPSRRLVPSCTALNAIETRPNTEKCTCTLFGFETIVLSGCGVKLLIDPFITGEMVVGSRNVLTINLSTEYQGIDKIGDFDAIVLTSAFPDHLHEPSMREIARFRSDVPIVAPKQTESMLQGVGFNNLTLVSPGNTTSVVPIQNSPVRVLLGPATRVLPSITPQFALLFDFNGSTVYYEPHGENNPKFLKECQRADAVIVPGSRVYTKGLEVSVVGDPKKSLELVRALQPSALVTRNYAPGTTTATGWFADLVQSEDAGEIYRSHPQLRNVDIIDLEYAKPVVIAESVPVS